MVDMSKTIAPKSDQLNFDDLMGGPIVIKITKVTGNQSPEQPVSVHFEGDQGKPYKPCKSMRRVMVAVWGPDAATYAGRAMRLYGDPKVKFGGMEVGGIRISHMSHIDQRVMIPLTVAKARRTPYQIDPLKADDVPAGGGAGGGAQTQDQAPTQGQDIDVEDLIETAKDKAGQGVGVYRDWFMGLGATKQRALASASLPDPGNFDQPASAHEVLKGFAAAADAAAEAARAAADEGAENEY